MMDATDHHPNARWAKKDAGVWRRPPGLVVLIGGLMVALLAGGGRSVYAQPTAPQPSVITLAPHLTEWVFSAGAGQHLIATVAYSDYPTQAQTLPRIGHHQGFQVEQILAFAPDLVLAWPAGGQSDIIHKLRALGVKVWPMQIQQLQDIPKHIRALGQYFHTQALANARASELEHQLKQLHSFKEAPAVSYFYQLWHAPLMTINGNHFISQGLALCGGRNIFENAATLTPQVSREAVLQKNPSHIFMSASQAQWHAKGQGWRAFTQLQAVKHDQLIAVDADRLQRPTARLIEYLPQLCAHLSHKK